jgi:hypothetical protein
MQFISRIIIVAVVMTTLLVSSFTIPTPKTSLTFTSCLVPSVTSSCRLPTQRFLSDQWDDEEEDLPKVTSYDDAATTLMKRKEEMDLMDQSDQGVPGVSYMDCKIFCLLPKQSCFRFSRISCEEKIWINHIQWFSLTLV